MQRQRRASPDDPPYRADAADTPWYLKRFVLVTCVLFAGAYGYLGVRTIGPSGVRGAPGVLAWIAVAVCISLAPLSFWLRYGVPHPAWRQRVDRVMYALLGPSALAVSLMALRDAVWWVASLLDTSHALVPASAIARQHLLQDSNLVIFAAVAVLSSWGIYSAHRRPAVRRVRVPVAALPEPLDGLRILQLSDLHLGRRRGSRRLNELVEQALALEPDLVAITGDLANAGIDELGDALGALEALHAPLGCYFVTGNHEYYSGAERWIDALEGLGVDVLLNEHRLVERRGGRLLVAGVTDLIGGHYVAAHRSDLAKAARGAPEVDVRILLAHQPGVAAEAARLGFQVQLSGHTHGGQILPVALVMRLFQPFVAGLHRIDGMWLYVSRGVGYYGVPMRLGVRSEIALLTLVRR